ncbi:hypothetical protein U1Q18_052612 [Sarracenia purpurea var. burkii]
MHRVSYPFDLIHSDMWGPSPVTTFSGHRYCVAFIDDHFRYTWIYLLKRKSDVFPLFTQFLHMIKTQFNTIIRDIRSDNGGEYISDTFRDQLTQEGILQQLTCPYIPEQNGVVERKNSDIMSVVRCLLRGMHVPSPISIWLFLLLFISLTVLLVRFCRTRPLFRFLSPKNSFCQSKPPN